MKIEDIYIYGEVLFDCFENGEDKLGGAPFNVAWNLKGFGLNPKMLTSVGKDALGEQVLKVMKNWNMDTSCVNILEDKDTGSVKVKVDEKGVPTYTIENDCAYDYIDIPKNINKNSIVYHGSLALRNSYNQDKCEELKENLDSNTFIDINLREPWWDNSTLEKILDKLKWLKINDEELPFVCKSFSFNSEDENEQVDFLLEKLNLELLILTKGEDGADLISKNKEIINLPIVKVDKIADTVGAGDAFASVVIYGLYNSWSNDLILKRAIEFSSKVCTLNGAITEDKEFYNNFLKKWTSK